jgi:hypothetical protein
MSPLVVDAPLSVPLLFLVAIPAAVVATLAMDLVMPRLREGETPPQVASGVLTERAPDNAPRRLASVVHYVAGALTGPLFVWLFLVANEFLSPPELAGAAAGVVLYPLMVGFFVLFVLPRASGMPQRRASVVARAWAIEAFVYVLVLVPLVTAAALYL